MSVRWQRLFWLWGVSASALWVAWFGAFLTPDTWPVPFFLPPSQPRWWLALAPVWMPCVFNLTAFGIEMGLVAHMHGNDLAPRPSGRALAVAAVREAWLAVRVFGWRQPWRSAAWPDRTGVAGVQGVVLVHGYLCNRAVWRRWFGWLRAQGLPYVGLNLAPAWADIDHYAPQLEQAVARLVRDTGRTPLLVGHSMGGLVIRAWWRWRQQRIAHGAELVAIDMPHVLTLGTPHRGTGLSRWGGPVNVQQMALDSDWLRRLLGSEDAAWRGRFTCVHSHCDNAVFPPATALLPGARAVHWPGLAHLELAHDPRGCRLAGELLGLEPAPARP